MNRPEKLACLTIDLEQDYGDLNPCPTFDGLALVPAVIQFSRENATPLSWFVQGLLFRGHPCVVENVARASPSDVYLHGYSHADPRKVDHVDEIWRGAAAFEAFCGEKPVGYRAPLGVITSVELEFLAQSGFSFDSSVFPTWRPGRFCNLGRPNRPHPAIQGSLLEIPVSVVGRAVPVPLSLSYLKLAGGPFRHALRAMPLPNVVVVGMHLHDLQPLASLRLLRRSGGSSDVWLMHHLCGSNAASGWGVLGDLVSLLRNRGYRFGGLRELSSSAGAFRT